MMKESETLIWGRYEVFESIRLLSNQKSCLFSKKLKSMRLTLFYNEKDIIQQYVMIYWDDIY